MSFIWRTKNIPRLRSKFRSQLDCDLSDPKRLPRNLIQSSTSRRKNLTVELRRTRNLQKNFKKKIHVLYLPRLWAREHTKSRTRVLKHKEGLAKSVEAKRQMQRTCSPLYIWAPLLFNYSLRSIESKNRRRVLKGFVSTLRSNVCLTIPTKDKVSGGLMGLMGLICLARKMITTRRLFLLCFFFFCVRMFCKRNSGMKKSNITYDGIRTAKPWQFRISW